MISYFKGGYEEAKKYSKGSRKEIYPICPNCGKISKIKYYINHLYSRGFSCTCNMNGISYPELFMLSVLDQLGIDYIFQPSFKHLGYADSNKKYDFYIPSKSIIIETHGLQHYENIQKINWKKQLEAEKNDKYKYDMAISHGIKYYIVIDSRHSTTSWMKKNILNSLLPDILNFSEDDINWALCSHYKKELLIKKICEDYTNNYLKVTELADKYNLSITTIGKYLSIGNEQNWCIYNHTINTNFNPIEVFYKGEHIGFFRSHFDLEQNAFELFNIKLCHKYTINALKKDKEYKGFSFKLVEDIPLKWEILKSRAR